jgi:hypothetical protein
LLITFANIVHRAQAHTRQFTGFFGTLAGITVVQNPRAFDRNRTKNRFGAASFKQNVYQNMAENIKESV